MIILKNVIEEFDMLTTQFKITRWDSRLPYPIARYNRVYSLTKEPKSILIFFLKYMRQIGEVRIGITNLFIKKSSYCLHFL